MIWPVLSSSVLSRPVLAGTLRSAAGLLRPPGPRLWRTEGGVQVRCGGWEGRGRPRAARRVESALRELPGVRRAEVNGTLGCVYVGCEPEETDLERVAALVAEADVNAAARRRAATARASRVPGRGGCGARWASPGRRGR
ncbi:hypothetical protein SALBM311S_02501 [Streptomyces alboniger]